MNTSVETEPHTLSQLSDIQLVAAMRERFYEQPNQLMIEEKSSQPAISRLTMQTKLYQLFKDYGHLTYNQIKTIMPIPDFNSTVLPILNDLVENGVIKKEAEEKMGRQRIVYRKNVVKRFNSIESLYEISSLPFLAS